MSNDDMWRDRDRDRERERWSQGRDQRPDWNENPYGRGGYDPYQGRDDAMYRGGGYGEYGQERGYGGQGEGGYGRQDSQRYRGMGGGQGYEGGRQQGGDFGRGSRGGGDQWRGMRSGGSGYSDYGGGYGQDPDDRYRGGSASRGYGSGGQPYGGDPDRGERVYPTGFKGRTPYADDHRSWWDRASDEVTSRLGDDDAERRRRMDAQGQGDHRGRGPKNYTRSDQRILDDVCDHLSDDSALDASEIHVKVENREVTLSGMVNSRNDKRRAEDCAERISGVTHVQNDLRVKQQAGGSESHGGGSSHGMTSHGAGSQNSGFQSSGATSPSSNPPSTSSMGSGSTTSSPTGGSTSSSTAGTKTA